MKKPGWIRRLIALLDDPPEDTSHSDAATADAARMRFDFIEAERARAAKAAKKDGEGES